MKRKHQRLREAETGEDNRALFFSFDTFQIIAILEHYITPVKIFILSVQKNTLCFSSMGLNTD